MWKSKMELRDYVWNLIIKKKVAAFPYPPHGRIPNFVGAVEASKQIRKLDEYRKAECIFSPPDGVLIPLRRLVLADGKILAYSTPHMKSFKMMKPGTRANVTIRDLIRSGELLTRRVDIAVVGSVAVDLKGNRIGKGSGYGDKELAYLKDRNPNILSGTLVHSLQVFEDFSQLAQEHDIPVDFVLTEKEIIIISS
ncbi:MAG: 5-formyltetrahydrofolate cyclo-ligase [Candidatus Jordarchaeum sp.]|uniref:5-formyltetrahydrofolate cyclo-ligase n=1 Tax=Candidatus Jordarchaeum sp. TaxID=2823881 RepID=UPI00404AD309